MQVAEGALEEKASADNPLPEQAAKGGAPPLPRAVPAPALLPEEALMEAALTCALSANFGFPAFRGLQLRVIQAVLRGRSTLAILPTGTARAPGPLVCLTPACDPPSH